MEMGCPDSARMMQEGVAFPEVNNLTGVLRRRVNTLIREQAYRAVPEIDPAENIIEATSSYSTGVNRNSILSLRFEDYVFWEHAAHGLTVVRSITLNICNAQVYSFSDLFDSAAPYRERVNAIIRDQIEARQIPLLREFEGVYLEQEYYLTGSELVIYYQLYDYTPYAYGILEFVIPYGEIEDLIDKNGPITRVMGG